MVDNEESYLYLTRTSWMVWFAQGKIYLSCYDGGGTCAAAVNVRKRTIFPRSRSRRNLSIPPPSTRGTMAPCRDDTSAEVKKGTRVPTRPSTRLMSSCNGCTATTSLLPEIAFLPSETVIKAGPSRSTTVIGWRHSGSSTGRWMKDLSLFPCESMHTYRVYDLDNRHSEKDSIVNSYLARHSRSRGKCSSNSITFAYKISRKKQPAPYSRSPWCLFRTSLKWHEKMMVRRIS